MDKPVGPTSHDVVARARRIFGTRAVGHTGTLDPFATGLLVLVFGGATRLARWGERQRKGYRAVIRLGVTTDTDDRTGRILVQQHPSEWPAPAAVQAGLSRLTGALQQRPPAFSAKRVAGVRSHRVARRGGTPMPPAGNVMVYQLDMVEYQPPLLTLAALVGPGTYLRALGRDLGDLLGTGAHLVDLRRESIGPWTVGEAHPLDRLTGRETLLPPRALVQDLPAVELSAEEVARVRHGREVERPGTTGEAALLCGEELVAVARASPSGWHPAVVLQ